LRLRYTIIAARYAYAALHCALYCALHCALPADPMLIAPLRMPQAIDMSEITERVTIQHHKSFVFHGAIFKMSRDILSK
jgi:hypothetical protein